MTPHLGRDITKLRTAEQTPDISTFLWFFLPYFGSVTCFRLYTGRQFLQSVCLNISNPSPTLSTPRRKAQKRDWVICQLLQGHFPRPLTIKKKKEKETFLKPAVAALNMLPAEILAAEPPERSTPSRSNNLVGTDFPPSREFPGLLYRTGPQQGPTRQCSNQDYGSMHTSCSMAQFFF